MIIEREKSRRRVLSGHPLEWRLPPRRGAASSRQRGRWRLPPDPVRHHRRTRGPSGWTLLRLGRFERHAIEVPVIARGGALWTRVSLQVYNDAADVERLADAVDALC